jgi:hypothetical protein
MQQLARRHPLQIVLHGSPFHADRLATISCRIAPGLRDPVCYALVIHIDLPLIETLMPA